MNKTNEIRLYLINRYLHNHPLIDIQYTKIKDELYDKVKSKVNSQSLEDILKPV